MLNRKIITAKEKLYLISNTSNDHDLEIFKVINLFLIILIPLMILDENLNFAALQVGTRVLFAIFCLLFLIFCLTVLPAQLTDNEKNIYLGDIVLYALDYVLPGKFQRDIEFLAFCKENPSPNENKNQNSLFNSDKFKVTMKDLPQWINTYVGKEKSIFNIIIARCSDNSGFRKELLFWSQIIPLKRMTIDDSRLLLMTNQMTSPSELIGFPGISPERIEYLFSDYDPKDIVKLFTSAYKIKDYLDILSLAHKYELKLAVRKTINDLSFYIKECVSTIEGQCFYFQRNQGWIKLIEGETELGTVLMIDNVGMLENWASVMRNCIKTKRTALSDHKSYLFGIIQDGEPYLIFELNRNGKLIEAKRAANRRLSAQENQVLKRHLQKII